MDDMEEWKVDDKKRNISYAIFGTFANWRIK